MSFFKGPNKVEELAQKSANIVDVFTRTVNDLARVNDEIEKVSIEKINEKAKLERDIAALASQKDINSNVMNKINKIFED